MKQVITIFIGAVLFLTAISHFAQQSSSRILFVNLTFINGTPEITSMRSVKGKLKTKKSDSKTNNVIGYEVVSKSSKILFKGEIEDPSVTVYEAPSETGEIKSVVVQKDSAQTTIRMPYCANIDHLILFKGEKAGLMKSKSSNENNKFILSIDHALIKKE